MSAMPDGTLADSEHLIANLHRQLAECRAERDEALQRGTATAEVLQVINAAYGDLAPVLDTMLVGWLSPPSEFKAASSRPRSAGRRQASVSVSRCESVRFATWRYRPTRLYYFWQRARPRRAATR